MVTDVLVQVENIVGVKEKILLISSIDNPAPMFFPRIDDSHYDRIHPSWTTVYCFHDGYERKQPVAWIEYNEKYLSKEHQETMERCTGHCPIAKELLICFVCLRFTPYQQYFSCLMSTVHKSMFHGLFLTSA